MDAAESDSETATAEPRQLAGRLAEIADSKGATDIVLLEIGKLVSYTDYLLICTARNDRMAAAIADEVRLVIKREYRRLPLGADGNADTGWQIMDYLDCVLHIFTTEARDRYQLEDLWREAPREELSDASGAAPSNV